MFIDRTFNKKLVTIFWFCAVDRVHLWHLIHNQRSKRTIIAKGVSVLVCFLQPNCSKVQISIF